MSKKVTKRKGSGKRCLDHPEQVSQRLEKLHDSLRFLEQQRQDLLTAQRILINRRRRKHITLQKFLKLSQELVPGTSFIIAMEDLQKKIKKTEDAIRALEQLPVIPTTHTASTVPTALVAPATPAASLPRTLFFRTSSPTTKKIPHQRSLSFHLVLVCSIIISLGLLVFFMGSAILGLAVFNKQFDGTQGTDSYLREDSPNSNFGTVQQLSLGLTAGGQSLRPLFYFNLSNISTQSTVTEATFLFYVADASPSTAANISASLYRLTSPWSESGVTWVNSTASSSWTSGGAYSSVVESSVNISNASGWYSINIQNLVQYWVNGSYDNHGFILIADTESNNNRLLHSSDYTGDSSLRPIINITYLPNAGPTVNSITDDSNASSPTNVGSAVNFTLNWSDLDSSQANIYICNSSSIIYASGCSPSIDNKQFCSTSLSSSPVQSCQYTALNSDNTTVGYYAAACDNEGDCSAVSSQQTFEVNHNSSVLVVDPAGGQTINQSQGNYSLRFNVTDRDNDTLTAALYYSTSSGAKSNLIVSNLALNSTYCTDSDGTTSTVNNCTYSWNSSGVGVVGISYWLDIVVNDSFALAQNSSNSSFSIVNLLDVVAPKIGNITITSNLTSGETALIRANITDDFVHTVWVQVNNTLGQFTNYSLSQEGSTIFYNLSFETGVIGTYYYRIYANDSLGNLNFSSQYNFSVSLPNATPQNQLAPAKSLPASTILVSNDLNTTDVLKNAYAYLQAPSGFIFHNDYAQNRSLGNLEAGNVTTTYWFLAVPTTESTYAINVSYRDNYSNSWTSNSSNIQVTTNVGNPLALSADAGGAYYSGDTLLVRARVEDNSGNGISTAAVTITVNYPNSTALASSAAMTNAGSGYYNYSLPLSSVPNGVYNVLVSGTSGGSSSIAQSSFSVLSSSSNATAVNIISYVEVEAGNNYIAEIHVKNGAGNYVAADSVSLRLYDPVGALFVGPVNYTSLISTGRYLYNRTTTSSWTGGHWRIEAVVTVDGRTFNDSEFFKITSGPFDVRDITITDAIVPDLGASVVLENLGGSTKDIVVNWELTRTDTSSVLNSGQDTIGVAGGSAVVHTVTPSSSYVGNVKLTFLGYYGVDFTEVAGAFKTFTTLSGDSGGSSSGGGSSGGGSPGSGGPSGGGTSGGSAGAAGREVIQALPKGDLSKIEFISAPKTIVASAGLTELVEVIVNNTGFTNLSYVSLNLSNLPSEWYVVSPSRKDLLSPDEGFRFNIIISLPETAARGNYDFVYLVESTEAFALKPGVLTVRTFAEELQERLGSLREELEFLQERTQEAKKQGIDVALVQASLDLAKEKLAKAKVSSLVNVIDAARYADEAEEYLDNAKKELLSLGFDIEKEEKALTGLAFLGGASPLMSAIIPYLVGIFLVVLIGGIIFMLYMIRRRMRVYRLFDAQVKSSENNLDEDNLDKNNPDKDQLGGNISRENISSENILGRPPRSFENKLKILEEKLK